MCFILEVTLGGGVSYIGGCAASAGLNMRSSSPQCLPAFISHYAIPGGGLTLWAALGLWLLLFVVFSVRSARAEARLDVVVAAAQLLQCVQPDWRAIRFTVVLSASASARTRLPRPTHVNTTVITLTPLKLLL